MSHKQLIMASNKSLSTETYEDIQFLHLLSVPPDWNNTALYLVSLNGIEIPIISLRLSSDRQMFIMRIPMPVRQRFFQRIESQVS